MNFSQVQEYLSGLSASGSKPGLGRIKRLLSFIGEPHKAFPVVHIAGTNGKGSVTAMLASALSCAGYKVGAYFSPYVCDVRECFSVCGNMPDKRTVSAAFSKVKAFADVLSAEGDAPSEYEVITAAAFLIFKNAGCDIVCLEACMGGKGDVTDVSETTVLSVLTQIGIDHTKFLGNTVAEITAHKCGILRPGTPCISYPGQSPDAEKVILSECKRLSCPKYEPDISKISVKSDRGGISSFRYKNYDFSLSMPGKHQVFNAATAAEALFALKKAGFNIPDRAVLHGISSAFLPARTEILSYSPFAVLDSAHNTSGITALCKFLDASGKNGFFTVMGMLADKDHSECIARIAKRSAKIYTAAPKNARALSAEALCAEAKSFSVPAKAYPSPKAALRAAIKEAGDAPILICGSFYISMILRDEAIKIFREEQK